MTAWRSCEKNSNKRQFCSSNCDTVEYITSHADWCFHGVDVAES